MTSTQNPLHNIVLTPQQQSLLFAALNSNKPTNTQQPDLSGLPSMYNGASAQGLGPMGYQHNSDFGYDYGLDGQHDSNFDFNFDTVDPHMTDDRSNAPSASKSDSLDGESPDKRSHPDDDEEENSEPKRREGEGKVAKKPGRKPLTTEPSSKRKAQNRAAQRAFRERKEKHLKDLENKVEELKKISETANHENELLRKKMEKMSNELNEYKKRLSLMAARPAIPSPRAMPFGSPFVNNINDVNFQFEFPKFGGPLPGPQLVNQPKKAAPVSPPLSSTGRLEQPTNGVSTGTTPNYGQIGLDTQTKEELAHYSTDLFTPQSARGDGPNFSTTGTESQYNVGAGTSTSSPSSSTSNMGGASSSCGTSPEPLTHSPAGLKSIDTMATIGEEQPGVIGSGQPDFNTFGVDNSLTWLPQDNFQFDPQLFGDYREPQNNVLNNGADDWWTTDALDADFLAPYNLPPTAPGLLPPQSEAEAHPPKKDLISQIDEVNASDDGPGEQLDCNKIWDKLRSCPSVQNQEIDMDALCSDLQKKAKCSGHGAVVDEKEFKSVLKKHLSPEAMARCERDCEEERVRKAAAAAAL